MATNIQGNCCKTQVWLRKGKKKKKTPHACCKQSQPKKKALQGWGSLMDGLLFNPQSYGDKSSHWKLWRYCVTQGMRQRGGKTAPGAEQRRGGDRRLLLHSGAGEQAGAGRWTEAAVSLGGQMDKFWGTALRKQSVWRGDGGTEPKLTTSSRDREMLLRAKTSTHSLQLLAPHLPLLSPIWDPLGHEIFVYLTPSLLECSFCPTILEHQSPPPASYTGGAVGTICPSLASAFPPPTEPFASIPRSWQE